MRWVMWVHARVCESREHKDGMSREAEVVRSFICGVLESKGPEFARNKPHTPTVLLLWVGRDLGT